MVHVADVLHSGASSSFVRTMQSSAIHTWLAAAAALLIVTSVHAADFPQRPITIIVPYTAGGSSDVVARVIGKQLTDQMGQPVIVENKPGAGATLGTALVARAAPDGYTVLLADNAQTTAPSIYPKLPYDAVTNFRGIGMVGVAPAMLLSSQKSKLRGVKDMRDAEARAHSALTIGVGSGSPSHLISALFAKQAKLKLQMIPYKGASQAITDVLGGQIEMIFTNPASAGQYAKDGRMNVVGVTGAQRLEGFPEVPTFKEQGISGLDNVTYWFALLAPVGLPSNVMQRWQKEVATAVASPAVSRALTDLGISKTNVTPQQMQKFLAADRAVWDQVAKDAGIKFE